ncbi:MAG: hypothetical protein ACFFER_01360 [Candidatus Thorarchaeota archaeon]
MTEEGLNAGLSITEGYDIERRMAIVARMTADRPYFEATRLPESPQSGDEDEEKL